jgi:hypothetical protein
MQTTAPLAFDYAMDDYVVVEEFVEEINLD